MKNKFIYIVLGLWVVCIGLISAEVGDTTGNLVIHITGYKSTNGDIRVALVNSKKGFLTMDQEIIRYAIFPPKDKKVQWLFEDVPYGTYAVMVFHDENKNAKLDRGVMGIPKESYGVSNNHRARYGPPNYKKARFKLESSSKTLNIKLK